ncbi:cytochrome c oxidase subunit 6A, mitochondrial-like [Discoglossus pictus]
MSARGARMMGQLIKRQMGSAAHGEGPGPARTWKILSFVVALPSVGVCILNAWLQKQNHPQKNPDFVAYSHLRIRTKPFPWGDGNHSFFHNPHANPLPTGYESAGGKH